MMLYKNTETIVRSSDGDTGFFDIVAGVLLADTIALYSSSSSYRAGSTDIPDPLSPLLSIVHRPR